MALQKLVPTGGLAAQRSGIQSAAVADVVDGRIAQLESEIVQGTHDALAAPGWIFLEQFDHEFLQRRIDGWSTDGVGPGRGPLLGDQDTEPTEQGIGSDKGGPSPQAASADELGFARQPDALGVGEALGFATELFQENPVFFLEVYNDSLLVSAHPAGDRDEQELELRRHRVENLSKVLVAPSSIWSRLNFLAIGSCFGIFDHLGQCSSVTKARKQSALDGEMNCFGKTRWKLLFDSAHRFFCNFLNFRQCFACERPRQSSAFGGLHKMPTPNILDLIVPTDPDRHCQFHLFTLDLAVVQARLRCQNVI